MFHILHRPKKIPPIAQIAIASFFVSTAWAIIDSVWSIHLHSFIQNPSIVGFITAGFTTLNFLLYFLTGPVIERVNEKTLWFLGTAAACIGFFLYSLVPTLGLFLLIAALTTVFLVLLAQAKSIIFRDIAPEGDISQIEGLHYALGNMGWLIAPLIGGFALATVGVHLAFMIASSFMFLAFLLMRFTPLHEVAHTTRTKFTELWQNGIQFFSDKKRRISFFMNGGVSLWWGVLYTYVPLYIIYNNLPLTLVGIFLALIIVPLVVFEIPIGKMTIKITHRRLFIFGHTVIGICAISTLFLPTPTLVLTALFLASFGAACLEPTKESYYYSITSQAEEKKYLGVWMTATHSHSTLGKVLMAAVLSVATFTWGFAVVGVYILTYAFVARSVEV